MEKNAYYDEATKSWIEYEGKSPPNWFGRALYDVHVRPIVNLFKKLKD